MWASAHVLFLGIFIKTIAHILRLVRNLIS
jgi:hypothetical protein